MDEPPRAAPAALWSALGGPSVLVGCFGQAEGCQAGAGQQTHVPECALSSLALCEHVCHALSMRVVHCLCGTCPERVCAQVNWAHCAWRSVLYAVCSVLHVLCMCCVVSHLYIIVCALCCVILCYHLLSMLCVMYVLCMLYMCEFSGMNCTSFVWFLCCV